jgi:hypothetical protein
MMFITSLSPARSRRLSTMARSAPKRLASARAELLADVLFHHRRAEQVVGRDIEEALDLARVQLHRQHPVRARLGDQVGDELGGDRRASAHLPVLPGVAEVRHHRRDPPRRRAHQRVHADQQLHEIVVGRRRGGLHHEHVLAADVLLDDGEDFPVLEPLHVGLAQGRVEVIADRLGEGAIRVAAHEFHRRVPALPCVTGP